jgi:maltooligosyltrehalose trehalohydrolase
MDRDAAGFFATTLPAAMGDAYAVVFEDGRVRPDPASRWQPEGVHAPSVLYNAARYAWTHSPPRRPLGEYVFYEMHVGTFTPGRTLEAASERLAELVELGITCVELMPLQPFPGARNWGYDGVYPYGIVEAYGGPQALQRFVDRAHGLGLSVCLDVVFNHLGPEGNYTREFGPYFTDRHRSPWGDGVNYDGTDAEPVRAFAREAALQWVRDFQVDALRLDAVQAITDESARHLVREIADTVHAFAAQSGRQIFVVAESDLNDRRVVEAGPNGWACDAAWADDYHHALHVLLTGEQQRYFQDFVTPKSLIRALESGFFLQGQHSAYHGRPRGTSARGLVPQQFVICSQNHDQVGNRPLGQRLSTLIPFEALEPVAALTLLAGPLPLLFMGEEYGESRPFLYFTSHSDPDLARAVTEGRKREFIAQGGQNEPPEPQAVSTLEASTLAPHREGRQSALREAYRKLLALRAQHLPTLLGAWPKVTLEGRLVTLRRPGLVLRVNLGAAPAAGLQGWEWRLET